MIDKYNPIDFPITISCKAATTINFKMLKKFQGGLKRLSDTNKEKLSISILKKGFTAPFFVWVHDDKFFILDGTQRSDALVYLRELGWEIPDLPVVYIEAEDKADAKEKLLAISSQYGEFDEDVLREWVQALDDEISQSVRLVDSEIDLSFKDMEISFSDDESPKPSLEPKLETCPKCGHHWIK